MTSVKGSSMEKPQTLNQLVSFFDKGYEFEGELNTRKLVTQMNRKKKKSGGFQSMGLCYPVYKGIMKKGYKVPTPIQRKCILVIMDGRDVVAMARTGSGKAASFLIPLFERLQARNSKAGARGLLFSPTRELALQTMQFIKELAKFVENERRRLEADSVNNPTILVCPPASEVFFWTQLCSIPDVKVVILGHDPYPQLGKAHSLAFSVGHGWSGKTRTKEIRFLISLKL